jgi:hypothetical protein
MTNSTEQNATCTIQLGKRQEQTHGEFRVAIIEAIDEGFSSFCNIDKEAVYHLLESSYKITKQEIPYKIEDFTDSIEQIFGVGAKLIEIKIIEALHNKNPEFLFFPKKTDFGFKEYVASLSAFWLRVL